MSKFTELEAQYAALESNMTQAEIEATRAKEVTVFEADHSDLAHIENGEQQMANTAAIAYLYESKDMAIDPIFELRLVMSGLDKE